MNFITIDKHLVKENHSTWDEEYAKNVYVVVLNYNAVTHEINIKRQYKFLDLTMINFRLFLNSDEYVFIKLKEVK